MKGILFVLLISVVLCSRVSLYVYFDNNGTLDVTEKKPSNWVAYIIHNDTYNQLGYSQMRIQTNPSYTDENQARAAGFAEGYVLGKRILEHRKNLFGFYLDHYFGGVSDFPKAVYDFLQTNFDYTETMIKTNPFDEYWRTVSLSMTQLFGIQEGFTRNTSINMSRFDIFMYNSAGDLLDLSDLDSTSLWWRNYKDPADFHLKWTQRNKCSGLVKLTKSGEVFISQVAWFMYGAMNRVMKSYEFNFNSKALPNKVMSFSSYPGFIYSFDDFYVLQNNMSVFETSISVFNETLVRSIQPRCVLEFIRVMTANRMTTTGRAWADTFARYNSGTYNNQWVIFDYKKLNNGRVFPGALTIAEQVPTHVEIADKTDELRRVGYFGSYNLPQLEVSIELANITAVVEELGPSGAFWNDPFNCCRANIFRAKHAEVVDMESMQRMMRYNQWQTDPNSVDPVYGRDAGAAIAARYDLRSGNFTSLEFGSMDAKIGSSHSFSEMSFYIISSPTYDDQPVFRFSDYNDTVPHETLPDKWNFPWELFVPTDF